ncbi:MAG: MBL fold metallo-hydrolase [Anaerolineales bacterium]|nr:MBL fold metallo-hydrolase [Anaerolineales bacterium]
MPLEVHTFPLGMTMTNAYLAVDSETKQAVVIDPGYPSKKITSMLEKNGWMLQAIWLTHAHFDHIGGVGALTAGFDPLPQVALHANDLPLWEVKGGAALFGLADVDPGPRPSIDLVHGQELTLGSLSFEVRLAPGHTPGHVMFYCAEAGVLFCGDVIFEGSIGRTDLPGGSYQQLIHSINTQVFTLPDETRLLNGHGPETTVGRERMYNPFVGR